LLVSTSNYKNGLLNGKKTYYYKYGGIQKEEIYYMGKLDGIVKIYAQTGKLIKEETYVYGTYIRTKVFSK
jgi:antitoxin component YwqK of YwqJK toxin-antitoxin module